MQLQQSKNLYFLVCALIATVVIQLSGCSQTPRPDSSTETQGTKVKPVPVQVTTDELRRIIQQVYNDNNVGQKESLQEASCTRLVSLARDLYIPTGPDHAKNAKDRFYLNVALHVLAIDKRGSAMPIRVEVNGSDCPDDVRGRLIISELYEMPRAQRCPDLDPTRYLSRKDKSVEDNMILDIICGISDFTSKFSHLGVQPVLFTFIHGGLNGFNASKKRVVNDLFKALGSQDLRDGKQARYYPLYFIWPSDIGTYGESLANYDQGQWYNRVRPVNWIVGALRFLYRDLPHLAADATNSYVQALSRYKDRIRDDSYDCDALENNDQIKLLKNFPIKQVFRCLQARANSEMPNLAKENAIDTALIPSKIVSLPVANTVGTVAWKNMLARARFATRRPCVDLFGTLPFYNRANAAPCGKGVYTRLFDQLNEWYNEPKAESPFSITLVGHSMGSIVATELLSQQPELPYSDVVFLGAAVSIREFVNSVGRTMMNLAHHNKKLFHFYNLSLEYHAEAEEADYYGAIPVGSLLEWIDGMYETPADFLERTLGKWKNVVAAAPVLAEITDQPNEATTTVPVKELLTHLHFGMFNRTCSSPLRHGDLASTSVEYPFCSDKQRLFGQSEVNGGYWNSCYWRWARDDQTALECANRTASEMNVVK